MGSESLIKSGLKIPKSYGNGKEEIVKITGKSIKVKAIVKAIGKKANKKLKLTSTSPAYATVNGSGKVKTYKAGKGKTVEITATAADGNGKKKTVKITGKTIEVKTIVKTTDKKANKKLKWTSSNPAYATVNASGKVKTYKAGKGKTVKITAMATDGSGKKKTVKIKIK